MSRRAIELLAPAKDAETAIQAILHGADAVYMGPASHGARKLAANSLDDMKRVVDFAHPYRVKVYATVNTLVYDDELPAVQALIWDLYRIGVDAVIIQDLGILRLDLPPIALHASTQCDAVPLEKAIFLEKLGFSQIVLPRELSLSEIRDYCNALSVPVECFVHGALCVSFSGRCGISQACLGRSGNRGECAQFCRMPYTLRDADGNVLAKDKYLLSLRDFNASRQIAALLDAGVSSFKIEGRLKDTLYVKNVTAAYREIIDREIAMHPDKYTRSSAGSSEVAFSPDLRKSFNRGFTDYFLTNRKPRSIASLDTNKSLGEPIASQDELHNGDGVSWFDKGVYTGMRINNAAYLPKELRGRQLYRTFDVEFEKQLAKPTAVRKIGVDIIIDEAGVSATDERGVFARVSLSCTKDVARKPIDPAPVLSKLGDTRYRALSVENRLSPSTFIPASELAAIRRRLVTALDDVAAATYRFDKRLPEDLSARYFKENLVSADNVANHLAEDLYRRHGVKNIEWAMEVTGKVEKGITLMTCRHCVLRELGRCLQETNSQNRPKLPLSITTGDNRFDLAFDCAKCQMRVLSHTPKNS